MVKRHLISLLTSLVIAKCSGPYPHSWRPDIMTLIHRVRLYLVTIQRHTTAFKLISQHPPNIYPVRQQRPQHNISPGPYSALLNVPYNKLRVFVRWHPRAIFIPIYYYLWYKFLFHVLKLPFASFSPRRRTPTI